MCRKASDNPYLHKDFHGALSAAIEYLDERFGEAAVREYLWQFARQFYAPLTQALTNRGLEALEEHLRQVYQREGGQIRIDRSPDELRIEVYACPAVTHIRRRGYPLARLFHETIATVAKAICYGTPFDAELIEYDKTTGHSVQRVFRKRT